MAYNAGPAPETQEDTTLYDRIAQFHADLESLAREHGLQIDRFETYDRSTQLTMRVDITATSVFLRERHPNYRRHQPYTSDTIKLEEGRHEAL